MSTMRIKFERCWVDYDGMLEIKIGIGNDKHWIFHETYTYREEIQKFGEELQKFPTSMKHQVKLFSDFTHSDNFVGMIYLNVFMLNGGTAAIQVKAREHDSQRLQDAFNSSFYVTCEPQFLMKLGSDLCFWCNDMTNAFEADSAHWYD